ncbi:MAG: hypothetical protein WBD40_21440 [Tepidisphaeraceae bacterium]
MKLVGKILLGGLAYGIGMVLGGMIVAALRLPTVPRVPGDSRAAGTQFLTSLLLAPLLMAALVPLVRGLRGPWSLRCLALAGLMFVTLGLNTIIELAVFSTMLHDRNVLVCAFIVLPALLAAAVMTSGEGRPQPSTLARASAAGWAWRVTLAWLAFPVIYFIFGMCVGPIVEPYYNAGIAGLKIPPVDVIIRTQFLRSLLFLVASLPAIVLWTQSRKQFILAMGLAHAVTVGLFPLAQASFFPPVLRVVHALEITADSFAYATVLGLLFIRSEKAKAIEIAESSPQLAAGE